LSLWLFFVDVIGHSGRGFEAALTHRRRQSLATVISSLFVFGHCKLWFLIGLLVSIVSHCDKNRLEQTIAETIQSRVSQGLTWNETLSFLGHRIEEAF
jgi:hypothetical protein